MHSDSAKHRRERDDQYDSLAKVEAVKTVPHATSLPQFPWPCSALSCGTTSMADPLGAVPGAPQNDSEPVVLSAVTSSLS